MLQNPAAFKILSSFLKKFVNYKNLSLNKIEIKLLTQFGCF